MAGQIALDNKYYPSDFNCENFTLRMQSTETVLNWPLILADKTIVVDSIQIYFPLALVSNARNVKFKVTTGGAPTYATTSEDVTDAKALSITAGDYPLEFSMVLAKTNNTPNNNVIPQGSVLWMQFDNSPAFSAANAISVQVRWRSQL